MSKKSEIQAELLNLRLQNDHLINQIGFMMHGIALAEMVIPFDQVLSDTVASGQFTEEYASSVIKTIIYALTPAIEGVREERAIQKKLRDENKIIVPEKRIVLS